MCVCSQLYHPAACDPTGSWQLLPPSLNPGPVPIRQPSNPVSFSTPRKNKPLKHKDNANPKPKPARTAPERKSQKKHRIISRGGRSPLLPLPPPLLPPPLLLLPHPSPSPSIPPRWDCGHLCDLVIPKKGQNSSHTPLVIKGEAILGALGCFRPQRVPTTFHISLVCGFQASQFTKRW